MSNTTLKCMWLTVVLFLSVVSLQATSSTDTPVIDRSTKEVIVINYDQFASDEVTSLVEYAQSTYNRIDNARVIIKDYSKESSEDNTATFKAVIDAFYDAGISSNNIIIKKEAFDGASAYFSITIGSATQVQ
ncbi:MAG: hypothetical protein ACI9FN_003094 [Saprospiraceae bacterium]|jgi:hypothetical protein